MQALKGLEPTIVMKYFEEISGIQRGSSHEKPMSDYLVAFAKERRFEVWQDDVYNICIKAPGAAGGEKAEPVILHGHMDIVWKKEEGSSHDFFKDPIRLYVEDGVIRARETTLGADNGIGVAYMLALMDSKDIPHPPLEIVLTVMEEMGKKGADVYDTSHLTAKRMIDFNWIDDKQILAGCSGDVSEKVSFPVKWQNAPAGYEAVMLMLDNMMGGHCELDIALNRGNAIVQLARVINKIASEKDIRLASIRGGVQNNVIPSEAEAVLLVKSGDKAGVEKMVADWAKILKKEYAIADPNINLHLEKAGMVEKVFSAELAKAVCSTIMLMPMDVITMNLTVKGNHETSNNLGILRTEGDEVWMITTITGAVTTRKHDVVERIQHLVDLAGLGGKVEQFGVDAPEFPYIPASPMLAMAKKAYKESYGKDPQIEISVFSLQLGFFIEALNLDTIGIGTEIHDIHVPTERMGVKSVENTWKFIRKLMADLCQ